MGQQEAGNCVLRAGCLPRAAIASRPFGEDREKGGTAAARATVPKTLPGSVRMYGEFKGHVYVRIPDGDDPDEILRLEVLDPELARRR